MNAGLLYLNPSLSASSRLFRELNADSKLLERFVVASSQLVTDLADRREDISGLVDNLATTTNAIGSEQEALGSSVEQLPAFMRRANTTFLNLRATLDDLDPLVEDSKPVARKLRPFLAELRPLAQDARPTFQDLSRLLQQPGNGNDLIDLVNAQPALRDIAVHEVNENGKDRPGAFPASTQALEQATPQVGYLRPYTADLLGWFDDFSHSGTYDALGGAASPSRHPRQRVRPARGPAHPGPAGAARRGLPGRRGERPAQPLPGWRRPRVRGRLATLEAVAGLQLRPEPDAPGRLMRRLLVIGFVVVVVVVVVAGAAAVVASAGAGPQNGTYTVELDNAFGVVEGADVKVAGVPAGQVTGMRVDRRSKRALVDFAITQTGFGSLRTDPFCETRPQSLIGEYFIDCNPGKSPEKRRAGATIPVRQSASVVPPDLVGQHHAPPLPRALLDPAVAAGRRAWPAAART